ncbi:hypothetical protein C8R43DRAFT_945329 [Mycena crocata]|nr:hypothetical protein C8R43DRAFT_945329 [Mycena crocata]
MDEYYDTKEAAERVGKWGDILAAPENEDQTVTMMRKISIQKHNLPLTWVAITSNTDVLRAEVCILMSDKECRERFAAQEVAIVGFNDDTFMCSITRVKDVVSWIAYDLPANRELDTHSWLAADEGNDLLLAVGKVPLKQRPFLTKMETDGMAHCYENEVADLQLENGRETSQKASIACRQARKPIELPIWTFNGMLTTSNHVDRKKRTFHLSKSEDDEMPLTRHRMGDMNLQDTDIK